MPDFLGAQRDRGAEQKRANLMAHLIAIHLAKVTHQGRACACDDGLHDTVSTLPPTVCWRCHGFGRLEGVLPGG